MNETISEAPEVKALREYEALLDQFQSVILGTAGADGTPEASYTPAIVDEDRNFYIYVSELSAHTENILTQKKASLLVIEDEKSAAQLFARKRVTFQCRAEEIARDSDGWTSVTDRMKAKLGGVFEHLMGMTDFHLIRLTPEKGRLVVGFGMAFDVVGDQMDQLEHVRGDGKGHRQGGHQRETAEAGK